MKVPVCILIQSNVEDNEQFRLLFKYLYHCFIINYTDKGKNANYKKIEIINILFFLYSNLFIPSPHSTISIKLPYLPNRFSIDFYFSSNFELPCNKSDNSIQKLFSYLDLSIIIKIVFKLLSEKTVILVSKETFILNAICPSILSLIFPFKWIYPYITIIPESQVLNFIETPTQYFFGITGFDKEDVIQVVKKEFVVDCDTNEIFSDKQFVSFCPLPSSDFTQKKSTYLVLENNHLKQINPYTNETSEILFLMEGKVIIDCDDENKLVTEHVEQYLSREESVKLREQIQKLKKGRFNGINQNLKNKSLLFLDEINEHNYERSFDYKMKKIFTQLIIEKFNENDQLYHEIKNTNMFIEYISAGEFENDSPKQIVHNVFYSSESDTKRCFDNSFKINFNIKSLENNERIKNYFKFHSKIFEDYLDIAQQLKNAPRINSNYTQNLFNLTSHQINFYGEDGVINIIKGLHQNMVTMQNFVEEQYNSQVLFYAIDRYKMKSKMKYAISFEGPNNLETHQYYNYLGKLFYELSKTNLSFSMEEKCDKDDYLLNNLIDNYKIGYMMKEDEFPFFVFHSILSEISKNKLHIILERLSEVKKLSMICENLILVKQKKEEKLKLKKGIKDSMEKHN